MQREARKEIGGLGSSHTAPCGAAVPARPPTRSSETTHLLCTPQWVRRATRQGTWVVVQRAPLPRAERHSNIIKLFIICTLVEGLPGGTGLVMLNSTTPDRPAFQPLSDARSTKTLLQDEARLHLDGGPLKRRVGARSLGCTTRSNYSLPSVPVILLEGGAGERVQGARAAYGTCFACPDRMGPPNIPEFLAHQPFARLVTSKGG
jgi:hypothetical protein